MDLLDFRENKSVSRVVIYNRVDCCQADSAPLALELSTDGKTFQSIARRNEPFEKWKVDIEPHAARYLRVHLQKVGTLQLNEVEVM